MKLVLKCSCGCWIWLGQENRNGYGRLKRRGRLIMAHKYFYELQKGPIGDKVLDHLCRNRSCVNPAHLEPVTVQVNTLRGEALLFGSGRCPLTAAPLAKRASRSEAEARALARERSEPVAGEADGAV